MPRYYLLSDFVKEIQEEKSHPARIDLIRGFATKRSFKTLLWYLANPDREFAFKKLPNFRPNIGRPGQTGSTLFREIYVFKHFLKESPMRQSRKESVFIQMLEKLHADEVDLIVGLLNHKVKYLTDKTIREACPDLFPEDVETASPSLNDEQQEELKKDVEEVLEKEEAPKVETKESEPKAKPKATPKKKTKAKSKAKPKAKPKVKSEDVSEEKEVK